MRASGPGKAILSLHIHDLILSLRSKQRKPAETTLQLILSLKQLGKTPQILEIPSFVAVQPSKKDKEVKEIATAIDHKTQFRLDCKEKAKHGIINWKAIQGNLEIELLSLDNSELQGLLDFPLSDFVDEGFLGGRQQKSGITEKSFILLDGIAVTLTVSLNLPSASASASAKYFSEIKRSDVEDSQGERSNECDVEPDGISGEEIKNSTFLEHKAMLFDPVKKEELEQESEGNVLVEMHHDPTDETPIAEDKSENVEKNQKMLNTDKSISISTSADQKQLFASGIADIETTGSKSAEDPGLISESKDIDVNIEFDKVTTSINMFADDKNLPSADAIGNEDEDKLVTEQNDVGNDDEEKLITEQNDVLESKPMIKPVNEQDSSGVFEIDKEEKLENGGFGSSTAKLERATQQPIVDKPSCLGVSNLVYKNHPEPEAQHLQNECSPSASDSLISEKCLTKDQSRIDRIKDYTIEAVFPVIWEDEVNYKDKGNDSKSKVVSNNCDGILNSKRIGDLKRNIDKISKLQNALDIEKRRNIKFSTQNQLLVKLASSEKRALEERCERLQNCVTEKHQALNKVLEKYEAVSAENAIFKKKVPVIEKSLVAESKRADENSEKFNGTLLELHQAKAKNNVMERRIHTLEDNMCTENLLREKIKKENQQNCVTIKNTKKQLESLQKEYDEMKSKLLEKSSILRVQSDEWKRKYKLCYTEFKSMERRLSEAKAKAAIPIPTSDPTRNLSTPASTTRNLAKVSLDQLHKQASTAQGYKMSNAILHKKIYGLEKQMHELEGQRVGFLKQMKKREAELGNKISQMEISNNKLMQKLKKKEVESIHSCKKETKDVGTVTNCNQLDDMFEAEKLCKTCTLLQQVVAEQDRKMTELRELHVSELKAQADVFS